MQMVEMVTFITFGASFVLLLSGMLLAVRLFNALDRKHNKYYQLLGRPRVFGYTSSINGYSQRLKGATFIYSMVFKGIPNNFPEDKRLKEMARSIRYVFTAFIVIFILLIILTYFYYRSGQ